MSFLDDFDPDDAKLREDEARWEAENDRPDPKPPTPANKKGYNIDSSLTICRHFRKRLRI